jgi:DNA-binding transcriptional ArsR family regulator
VTTYTDTVLNALSDPTRRSVLELVAERPRPVGELADALPVSRPAVSQHLRVLRDAGLLAETRIGTRHLYVLRPTGLQELAVYLQRFWSLSLESFKHAAEKNEKEEQ